MVGDSDPLFPAPAPQAPGPSPLGPVRAPTLTFGGLAGGPPDGAVRPDLQVGLCLLDVICVEVPVPDLAPKVEEGAGVWDGDCLAGSQQDSQHRDPQSRALDSGLVPAHQRLTSSGEVWSLQSGSLQGLDAVSDAGGLRERMLGLPLRRSKGPWVLSRETPEYLGIDAEAAEFIS